MSNDPEAPNKAMVVDPFCFRQFAEHPSSQSYSGTVFQLSIAEFEDIVNERYMKLCNSTTSTATTSSVLKDGYAPFCKHLFLPNDFTNDDARVNVLPITEDIQPYIRTEYVARTDKELPVLQRYIPLSLLPSANDTTSSSSPSLHLPVAKYLDIILYSREQIQKENTSMGKSPNANESDASVPWGIVSIKAQDVDYELPMNPITVMRNALGEEHGGSGKPLDKEAYMESVRYWKDHVIVS